MTRINFLTNAMIPGTLGMYQWDAQGRCIKDIILNNSFAQQHKVAEMHIHATRFSAIDEHGQEHFIADFPGQKSLTLFGIPSGRNIRTRSAVKLAPGVYKTLRFYTGQGSSFVHSDRRVSSADGFPFLDFEIEGAGLHLTGDHTEELILRFDFVPFKPFSKLRAFTKKYFPQMGGLKSLFAKKAYS